MTTIRLTLDGSPALVIRALRFLLKRLGRDFGLRCRAVAIEESSEEVQR